MNRKLFILMAALAVAACVDKSYDPSKGFDMSMSVDANLALPLGSTEFISIGDILKIDGEGDAGAWGISHKGDGYYIQIPGGTIRQEIDVPVVELEPISLSPVDAELSIQNLDIQYGGVSVTNFIIGQNVSNILSSYPGLPTELEVEFKDDNDQSPTFPINIDPVSLPGMISDIDTLDVNSGISLKFSLTEGGITLKRGLSLTFPEYFVIEAQDETLLDVEDGHKVTLKTDKALTVANRFELGLLITNIAVPSGSIQDDGIGGKKLSLGNSEIKVEGSAMVNIRDFETVPSVITVSIDANIAAFSVSRAKVKLSVSEHFSGEEITVDDLPEELQDVELDLWNPMIRMTINNGTAFSAEIDANVVTYKNNVETHNIHIGANGSGSNKTEAVVLKPNGESTYAISRQGNAEEGEIPVKIESLGDLFTPIPDKIVVNDIYVRTDDSKFMEITFPQGGESDPKYVVEVSYSLEAPLAFGDGLSINYPVKIDGLGKLFNSEEGGALSFDLKTMEISFTINNTFPLNIAMNVKALDADDQEITEGVDIDASLNIPARTQSPLKITLRGGEALSQVDALQLDLTVSNDADLAGIVFNSSDGLQILDIKGKLSATINADFSRDDQE